MLIGGKFARCHSRGFPASRSNSAPRRRSAGCSRYSSGPAPGGIRSRRRSGRRHRDRRCEMRSGRGQAAAPSQPCAIFQPAKNILDERATELAGQHDIDRAAVFQHHVRLRTASDAQLRRSSIRPWRMPRPRQAWRRGRSPRGSGVANAARAVVPALRAAPGGRQSRHHRAPRRGRSGPVPSAAALLHVAHQAQARTRRAAECLRRPRSSGTEAAALAGIEPSWIN